MRPLRAMSHTVTIVRQGPENGREDAYGRVIPSGQLRVDVTGCNVQPAAGLTATSESHTPTADVVETKWQLIAPPGTVFTPSDRVQVAADYASPVTRDEDAALDLMVEGDSGVFTRTGTSLDHVEVRLRRWQG